MAAGVHFFRREYERAAGQFRRTLELEPAFSYARQGLASSLALQGRYKEALEANGQTETNAWILALAGNRAEARGLLAKLFEQSKRECVGSYIHTALGDKAHALDELDRACRDQRPQLANLNVDPRVDSLRSEARFIAPVRRLNLLS